MVRFSPNQPDGSSRSRRVCQSVEVLALEGVHRLLVAAVVLGVPHEVPDQAAAEPAALGPGGSDLHRTGHRALADARRPGVLVQGFGSARPTLTDSSWPTGSA